MIKRIYKKFVSNNENVATFLKFCERAIKGLQPPF
jgi:hypothetical protein